MKPLPFRKPCFLCERAFLVEWARKLRGEPWRTSEICPECEERLREKAA